jgi:hypothetical protein
MDDIRQNLPMSMAMAGCFSISWYIGAEINVSLFMLFQQKRGLYFWSCALCSWGIILQPLFILLADFHVWTDILGAVTVIYLTWLIMVVPQSWVLYSRLHLIVRNQKMLQYIRYILIFNSVVFSVPTVVIGILAQATNINPSLRDHNLVWDRVQLLVFFLQETILSCLYIYETRNHLRITMSLGSSLCSSPTQAEKAKNRVLWNLVNANLLVILLDIVLLGIQFGGDHLFYLQGAFKPCVYGIKLKVEFLVLNQLIESIRARAAPSSYRNNTNPASDDPAMRSNPSNPRCLTDRSKANNRVSIDEIHLTSLGRDNGSDETRTIGDAQSSHSGISIVEREEAAPRHPELWDENHNQNPTASWV